MGADQTKPGAIQVDHVGTVARIRQVQAVGRPGGEKAPDGQRGQLPLIAAVAIDDVRMDRGDGAVRAVADTP